MDNKRGFTLTKHNGIDLSFRELKCPHCEGQMYSGNTTCGVDVQMVKKCDCGFWMIIIVPNKHYDYSVKREFKDDTNTISE
jgi:hypothetical protein